MPETDTTQEEELRNLLTDAIEVQLAALKAGVGFWSEWIDQTSQFVQSATDTLASINSGEKKTEDALLELLDTGRERARSMTEIPRHTAQRFLDELDAAEEKKPETSSSSGASKSGGASRATKSRSRTRPKRAGRAKD